MRRPLFVDPLAWRGIVSEASEGTSCDRGFERCDAYRNIDIEQTERRRRRQPPARVPTFAVLCSNEHYALSAAHLQQA